MLKQGSNKIFFAAISKILIIFIVGCETNDYNSFKVLEREPDIDPDYSGVTIPNNIAPMNFTIQDKGKQYLVKAISENGRELSIKSSNGTIRFKLKYWRSLLENSVGGKIKFDVYTKNPDGTVHKFSPFFMYVANDSIDPYVCYRLLYPGFDAGGKMQIVQRSLENFYESSVIENQLLDNNCINCHSFKQNSPDQFLFHVRGSMKGTYIINDKEVKRMEMRVGDMFANAVYPSWHPSGNFIVFSSNTIVQAFHMGPERRNEIYDLNSSLVIYSFEDNTMRLCSVIDSTQKIYNETFPCWSPDGDYLYYCRTERPKSNFNYENIKYDLVRSPFNQASGKFGHSEVIFEASKIKKSASVPSISPNGQYLIFALNDYGTSSIWHKDADLYLLNLSTNNVNKLSINSSESESYQSWSSNSKWIIFSSKRRDGLTARPYIAFFGSPKKIGKPFILPQKNPKIYDEMIETFNLPELVTNQINIGPRDFARASQKNPAEAIWVQKNN